MRKKLLVVAGLLPTLFSCTELSETKKELIESNTSIGKIVTVTLPNWDSGYTPKTKIFREDSSWGVMESTVVFKERKPAKAE